MRNLCTCRICKQMAFEDECVKYSTRHYAHLSCYVEAGRDHTKLPGLWQRAKVEAYLRRNARQIARDKVAEEIGI